MKYVRSKLLQKSGWKKQGRYLLTIEVTDGDVNNFEDLATCYVVKGYDDKPPAEQYDESHELDERYSKWANKVYKGVFHKLWREHDTCGCGNKKK